MNKMNKEIYSKKITQYENLIDLYGDNNDMIKLLNKKLNKYKIKNNLIGGFQANNQNNDFNRLYGYIQENGQLRQNGAAIITIDNSQRIIAILSNPQGLNFDINQNLETFGSILNYAIFKQMPLNIIQLLIQRGANPNIPTDDGVSPNVLFASVLYHYDNAIFNYLVNNCDVNIYQSDAGGRNISHYIENDEIKLNMVRMRYPDVDFKIYSFDDVWSAMAQNNVVIINKIINSHYNIRDNDKEHIEEYFRKLYRNINPNVTNNLIKNIYLKLNIDLGLQIRNATPYNIDDIDNLVLFIRHQINQRLKQNYQYIFNQLPIIYNQQDNYFKLRELDLIYELRFDERFNGVTYNTLRKKMFPKKENVCTITQEKIYNGDIVLYLNNENFPILIFKYINNRLIPTENTQQIFNDLDSRRKTLSNAILTRLDIYKVTGSYEKIFKKSMLPDNF
jgi:hypothetical protein